MDPVKEIAVGILGIRKFRELEDAGLTIVPMIVWEPVQDCIQETIIMLPSKLPLVVRPASPDDVERVSRGYVARGAGK